MLVSAADPVTPAEAGKNLCVHVGYQRTGTSFLQEVLFPQLAPQEPISGMSIMTSLARDLGLDTRRGFTAHILADQILFSCEAIIASVDRDMPEKAEVLRAYDPDCRIIFTIRSQFDIFRGVYFLYVKGGGRESYPDFVRRRAGRLFLYDDVIGHYQSTFGDENVLVLLHEELKAKPVAAMTRLLGFLGEDPTLASKVQNRLVKPSASESAVVLMRRRNQLMAPLARVWPGAYRWIIHQGLPGHGLLAHLLDRRLKMRLPRSSAHQLIQDTYGSQNSRLFGRLGIDAGGYDYPLTDAADATDK